MSKPLISIVLPVYNGSRHLDEAIESCLGQTYVNWELILVDDASTDDTPERMERYRKRDTRIAIARHPTNLKLPAALNTGFAMARGKLLTWTSDDNAYRPSALEEMAGFLDFNPDVDFVYTDYSIIDNHGRATRQATVGRPEELGLSNCIGPCFLYRRALMEAVGEYCDEMFLVEDYDYWLRCALAARLAPLHRDLYLLRVHDQSLSSLNPERVQEQTRKMLLAHLPGMGRAHRDMRAYTYIQMAKLNLARRDTAAGRRRLLSAIEASPYRAMCQLPCLVSQGVFGLRTARVFEPLYQNIRHLYHRLSAIYAHRSFF